MFIFQLIGFKKKTQRFSYTFLFFGFSFTSINVYIVRIAIVSLIWDIKTSYTHRWNWVVKIKCAMTYTLVL